ncbi:hypothetical protein [Clostridium sporogenes]|uniref:hypothetical protein n=1 Tax=Clostridium sporogenes TaxID=1509 RepID=UPI0022375CBC|nr:hypothetical protein [Clostridium sporogenes]MCW6088165.1 hypothetical protein [Clostridium sporogenes]
MEDLWGFKDARDLRKESADMPDSIIKEQMALLSDKTEGVIYVKPTNYRVKGEEIDYKLASVFEMVVPRLDNYATTLLILYSYPDNAYPVAITVGSNYVDDQEDFNPRYECRDSEEFLKAVKNILNSKEVIDKVKILFSKGTIY